MIEDCFITLFALYPSHIKYMRQYYKRLLTMPLQNCKHKGKVFVSILKFYLNKLIVKNSRFIYSNFNFCMISSFNNNFRS